MPRANAHHSPTAPAVTTKSGRSESCTIPTDLTPDARISTTEADGRPITPAPHASGNHLNLHDDDSQLSGTERAAPSRRAVLAAFTGAALVGAVLAIPTAEAAAPEPWKCRDHYETAMLLAFRKLSSDEQAGVMAFVREFGTLAGDLIPAAEHPDAELLALTGDLELVQARIDVLNGDPEGDIDDFFNDTLSEFRALSDRIAEIPASTPLGIKAKAKTLRFVHQELTSETSDHIARHTLGLVRDLVGGTME